jgi:hypothetical protein
MKKILLLAAFCTLSIALFAQWTTSGTNIYNSNTGNVGIGTTTPVAGNGKLQIVSPSQPGIRLETTGASWGAGIWMRNLAVSASGNQYSIYANELGQLIVGNETTHLSSFIIHPNGSVGMGTLTTGTFKLAVEGKIGAREVQVTNTTPWPDYVFLPDYKLRPLPEVEKFIKLYQHLPDVPSAEDVKGGVELGKMNAVLLQKIEELTLHLIELNKKIEKLEQEKKKD